MSNILSVDVEQVSFSGMSKFLTYVKTGLSSGQRLSIQYSICTMVRMGCRISDNIPLSGVRKCLRQTIAYILSLYLYVLIVLKGYRSSVLSCNLYINPCIYDKQ